MAAQKAQFEVWEGAAPIGQPWHWRLRAKNGEVIASGESYNSRKDALRGVAAVKRAVKAIQEAK